MLELNARPGISIQIANRAGLRHRLEAAERWLDSQADASEGRRARRIRSGSLRGRVSRGRLQEEERMHRSRITVTAGLVAALSFAGAGCQEEGPAEQAGKAIDEAAENAQEGVRGSDRRRRRARGSRRGGGRGDRGGHGGRRGRGRLSCATQLAGLTAARGASRNSGDDHARSERARGTRRLRSVRQPPKHGSTPIALPSASKRVRRLAPLIAGVAAWSARA